MTVDISSAYMRDKALDTWLATSPDLIFVKDNNLRYISASLSFARLVGHENDTSLMGKTDFEIFPYLLASKYISDDRNLLDSGIPMIEYVEPLPEAGDRKRYSSTSKYVICDDDGTQLGLLGIARDITDQLELADERCHSAVLRVRAETDSLTGLHNRDSIMNHVRDCIEGYGTDSQHAILLIDLDHFKQVNDTMGHPYGDKVLQEIAGKLTDLVRGGDLVGRIGGDEFLVLLRDVHSHTAIARKADEICRHIPIQISENGLQIDVTCSIGVSLYEGNAKSLELMYEEADRAMYRAKQQGRNAVVFYK